VNTKTYKVRVAQLHEAWNDLVYVHAAAALLGREAGAEWLATSKVYALTAEVHAKALRSVERHPDAVWTDYGKYAQVLHHVTAAAKKLREEHAA
jgi:hypothetical protein